MPATIRDVAARANVSVATVSRVLNGATDVGQDFRDRVLSAVADLGYRPSGPARSLRTRATAVFGIIITDITNPFFTAMVRGAEDAALRGGYSVILANTDENLDKERRYLEVAAAEQVAGVILAPASSTQTRIDSLTERNIPVVTVDRRLRGAGLDSVTVNNFRAARDATAHLLKGGCTRVAMIAGLSRTTTGLRRLAGYKAALREVGLPVDPSLIARADFRVDGGYQAARGLLRRPDPPDGLFVANNLMTVGALEALAAEGVDIPREIAIVGFDDTSWSTALRPALTAVSQPTYEMGQRAAELLIDRVGGAALQPRDITLHARLIVRGSSIRIPS
jgi:LacI family transcriptional regulator